MIGQQVNPVSDRLLELQGARTVATYDSQDDQRCLEELGALRDQVL